MEVHAAEVGLPVRNDAFRNAILFVGIRWRPKNPVNKHLGAIYKLVEVPGVEPGCPWPLRSASTGVVPFKFR